MDYLLEIRDIKKYFPIKRTFRQILYPERQQYVKAVDGVSFGVNKGKVFVIAGESGSGKTTVARMIMKATEPDTGSILFEEEDITKFTGDRLKRFRAKVQMIYQDPYSSLDPRMRILDTVMEPLNIHDNTSSKQQKIEKVFRSLHDVRLEPAAEVASKFPHMLSGGQRQRAALARALVLKPALIVADEPVSMLDVSVRAEILELMRELKEKFQISFVYITHDLSTARYIGDSIAIMYAGKIVEMGPIDNVLLSSLHPYTKALIDAVSEPDPNNLHAEKIIRIKEQVGSADPRDGSGHATSIGEQIGCRFSSRCPDAMEVCRNNDPELLESQRDHFVSCFLYHKKGQAYNQ